MQIVEKLLNTQFFEKGLHKERKTNKCKGKCIISLYYSNQRNTK